MTDQPDFGHKVEPLLEDAATEVQARAKKLMTRENTDFVGRMSEAVCEAMGYADDNDVDEYREVMLELAALALAQAAMCAASGISLMR